MKPKQINHRQGRLFEQRLSQQLNPNHELVLFSQLIDWSELESELNTFFSEDNGAPGKAVRLVAGILILQHHYGLSDERAIMTWVENPYWQLFCGFDYLQWTFPIDPSSLCNWRKRLGKEGMKKIMSATVRWAVDSGVATVTSFKQVIVDTTVMPKNIAYPTDGKLYSKGIKALVRFAIKFEIPLRQTYTFLAKKALRKSLRYAHARQMKRAAREVRRLKTYLGRIHRNVARELSLRPEVMILAEPLLTTVDQVLTQQRHDNNKVYSIHEPDVECISKGKAHAKYEFGCKTSIVITHKEGLALAVDAVHKNPYDGHTLEEALKEAEKTSGIKISRVFVDKGYRGHKIEDVDVFVSGKRGLTPHFKKQMKRRQAIEPHIGHMKSEGKLNRNYLKGKLGDALNAILCGIGHNVRMILRHIRRQADLSIA